MAPLPATTHIAGARHGLHPYDIGICACCGEVMAYVAEGLERWRECTWCDDYENDCTPADHGPRS